MEQKIEELGAQAVAIINDMVEDIIGGSSSDIAKELGDAFLKRFRLAKITPRHGAIRSKTSWLT